jgi:hypothetical protein
MVSALLLDLKIDQSMDLVRVSDVLRTRSCVEAHSTMEDKDQAASSLRSLFGSFASQPVNHSFNLYTHSHTLSLSLFPRLCLYTILCDIQLQYL